MAECRTPRQNTCGLILLFVAFYWLFMEYPSVSRR